jgi:hypothetical protein
MVWCLYLATGATFRARLVLSLVLASPCRDEEVGCWASYFWIPCKQAISLLLLERNFSSPRLARPGSLEQARLGKLSHEPKRALSHDRP